MVSTRPPTSKSSKPFNNPLVTESKASITIGMILTFMFHSFFYSLRSSRYLSFFSLSFSFIQWSVGTAKSTILQVLFFFVVDYYTGSLVLWVVCSPMVRETWVQKTLKIVLDTSLLNTLQYKVRIKGKVEQSRKRVAPSSTPRCSSYWKGSLLATLDYGRQLLFLLYGLAFLPRLSDPFVC